MISVPLWLAAEHACSYLDRQIAQSLVVDTDFALNPSLYSALVAQGFRRSGDMVYKPHCQYCQACIASRVKVTDFKPSRQQKRCVKHNMHTQVNIKPAVFDEAHFALYRQYQAARHTLEGASISRAEYMQFLASSWCNTWFVEFVIDNQLAAIAVVDVLDDGLSAVYTFFDSAFSAHSPGVFAVLWQIEMAKQLELDYVYLGFWIQDCQKMNYKNQYQPLSGLINQQWQVITNH